MKNAIVKTAIAKNVADYIIDHLLVEEPINAEELKTLALSVTEDRGITDTSVYVTTQLLSTHTEYVVTGYSSPLSFWNNV